MSAVSFWQKTSVFLFVSIFFGSVQGDDTLNINHSYFKPYVWSENGEDSHGIYVDIIKEAVEKRMGIPVKFQSYPWKRAQEHVKQGVEDAFITIPTKERLSYTTTHKRPIMYEPVGIFVATKNVSRYQLPKVTTAEELKPYMVLSYLGNNWVKTHLTDHKIDYGAVNLPGTLNQLVAERGDIVVGSKHVTLYSIKEMHLEKDIVMVSELKDNVKLFLCIKKGSAFASILDQLDINLEQMQEDGTLEQILKKYQ